MYYERSDYFSNFDCCDQVYINEVIFDLCVQKLKDKGDKKELIICSIQMFGKKINKRVTEIW